MHGQQAANNRKMVLQLTVDPTAVPLAEDVILHDFAQSTTVTGRKAVIDFIHTFFHRAFTDSVIEINLLLVDKETATLSLSLSGRQSAPFWGLPCTGRHITLSLTMIFRFHAGQITCTELFYDGRALLRQLGLAL
jgi:steroid delta-isomerase-like uncharacterized protein